MATNKERVGGGWTGWVAERSGVTAEVTQMSQWCPGPGGGSAGEERGQISEVSSLNPLEYENTLEFLIFIAYSSL